jgi:hypothetical protein
LNEKEIIEILNPHGWMLTREQDQSGEYEDFIEIVFGFAHAFMDKYDDFDDAAFIRACGVPIDDP